jgi:hypothetical protein
MIRRNYDASIIRWFDCVARGGHRFNNANICMQCGAARRGPTVTMVRGGMPRREKTK